MTRQRKVILLMQATAVVLMLWSRIGATTHATSTTVGFQFDQSRLVNTEFDCDLALKHTAAAMGSVAMRALAAARVRPKIFIYTLPHRDTEECGRNIHSQRMFAAEQRLVEYVARSPCRTYNASAANLFLVPVLSTCAMLEAQQRAQRAHVITNPHQYQRRAVHDALQYMQTHFSPLWQRRRGADHVWILAHDFGACMAARDYGHGVPVALRAQGLDNGVFITTHGDQPSTCYRASHNIVMPPVSPVLHALAQRATTDTKPPPQPMAAERNAIAYFRGTFEWKWNGRVDASYSGGVRQRLWRVLHNHSTFQLRRGHTTSEEQYQDEMRSVTGDTSSVTPRRHAFCLCPPGYADWSPRLIEAIVSGCVPVLFNARTARPFARWIDWSAFTVQLGSHTDEQRGTHFLRTDADAHQLPHILLAISRDDMRAKQTRLQQVAWMFTWSDDALLKSSETQPTTMRLVAEAALLFEVTVVLNERSRTWQS